MGFFYCKKETNVKRVLWIKIESTIGFLFSQEREIHDDKHDRNSHSQKIGGKKWRTENNKQNGHQPEDGKTENKPIFGYFIFIWIGGRERIGHH